MFASPPRPASLVLITVAMGSVIFEANQKPAWGQETRAVQANTLTVDGVVERIFQAEDQLLIQLRVQRSEAARIDLVSAARYPAPGEFVYIHKPLDRSLPPQPQTRIRAYLIAGRTGQWEADGNNWYEADPADRPATIGERSRPSGLGIVSERTADRGETLLKVVRVTPGSPAAKAGLEVGDLIVEADRKPLQSPQQLDDAYRSSRGVLALTVRDVRSGRDVLVNIEVDGTAAAKSPKPLGVETELAFYGGQPVVKVIEVTPGSPADRAGITAGLLILSANGTPVKSPEVLAGAEENARGDLRLKVVDPSDRRERFIDVSL